MSSSGIALETPLAEALGSVVHAKITEEGWSQEDDTSLAEYIVLMLVNGKTQDQIASELASELLQDVDGIPEFAQWLSDQVDTLRRNTASTSHSPQGVVLSLISPSADLVGNQDVAQGTDDIPAAYDADMGDVAPDNAYALRSRHDRHFTDYDDRPRGPKGMHGGRPGPRGGRMAGQVNKAMDRSGDSVLHRVRPQSGTERINSHVRGAPRGPRNVQNRDVRPGMQKALNGLSMPASTPATQNPMIQNGAQQGQSMMGISAQQQMEFMAMMEQQARMMAQFIPGMVQPAINPAFHQNGQQQHNGQGRSLFDRVEPGRGRGGRGRGRGTFQNGGARNGPNRQSENGGDTSMDTDSKNDEAPSSSMEVEQSPQQNRPGDPSTTMCRFNLRCINKDCPYVHQSPAAPEGTTVDMTDTCKFGVACKNSRCVGKHPSPAQIKAHQSEELCRFFPNCTNPTCGFKHPTMPICKNGANCTIEHCKFTHLQTPCRFKPCLNPKCPYKHEEGQKRTFGDYQWTANGAQDKDPKHVSERKFVTEDGDEELIKPEAGNVQVSSQEMGTNGQANEVIT